MNSRTDTGVFPPFVPRFPHGSYPPARYALGRRAAVGAVLRTPFAVKLFLVYLAAITIIGKGPTYIGIHPVYWGEVVMALLILWALRDFKRVVAAASGATTLSILILAFMALGVVPTLTGFGRWGTDAIRDAALWYYGCFYFIGIYLASQARLSDAFWKRLTVIWVLALVWGSIDLATHNRLSSVGPLLPRGVLLLSNSGSELGQNVALGAVILLSGHTLLRLRSFFVLRLILAFTGLGLFAASYGRGQKVAFAVAICIALLLTLGRYKPPGFAVRLLCFLLVAGVLAGIFAVGSGIDIGKATQLDRFLEADPNADAGTHYWRMIWWKRLNDAVLTTNPVFGLGFGINLCVYNPYLVSLASLQWVARSPHNFNVTVYSRMGIAGAAIWGMILISGIGGLALRSWRGAVGGRLYSPARREELFFWTVMLITTLINSSFGVLMEGPVLGIWFWFALGFASGRSLTPGTAMSSLPAAVNGRRVLDPRHLRTQHSKALA